MESGNKNFTPLPNNLLNTPKKTSSFGKAALLNGLSFFTALAILTSVYMTQTNQRNITLNTKAASNYACPPDITNPKVVSATTTVDNKLIDVKTDTTITSTNITLQWDAIPDAQHYYVQLSDDKGVPRPNTDPVATGKKTDKTSYTFLDLRPGDYYVYVRTVSKTKDKFGYAAGIVFPTPGVCTVFYAASPSLHFTVKQP